MVKETLTKGRAVSSRQRDLEAFTVKLVREIYSVHDRVSRTILLGERLRILDNELVLDVIHTLCTKAGRKMPVYQEILLSIIDIPTFAGIFGHGRLSDVYLLAQEKGYDDVVRILFKPAVRRGRRNSNEDLPFDPELEYTPLGVRKSMARGQEKKYLDRLLFDQEPSVIENLLLNPRITEKEVIKICARRPSRPEVLKRIFESKKWICRYPVKKALVRNPYTPPEIALRLLGFMLTPDLRHICQDASLHPDIRIEAQRLVDDLSSS